MSTTPAARPLGPWAVWTPVVLALVVTGVLATIGSLAVAFGVGTACTNEFSCTATSCTPCEAATGWLSRGWALQVLMFVTALALVVLAARRVRPRTVRTAAVALTPLSLAVIAGTTALAATSW